MTAAWSAPFVPQDPRAVLERLPARTGPAWDAIRELRIALNENPSSADVAAELARRYLDVFRAEGDPRLVAYAQTTLIPWEGNADPPIEIAMQRVLVAQTEHRFDAAHADLARLLARAPRESQAWLTGAAIALVRGDYQDSRRSCSKLLLLQDAMVAGACFAALQALTGEAEQAYEFLTAGIAQQGAELDGALALWFQMLAAETADGLALEQDADAHFRTALDFARRSGERPSVYLLVAYADFLLTHERPDAVIALLEDAPPADPILLRSALAKQRLGQPIEQELDTLRYRLQLSLTGEEDAHAREAAYFALHLLGEPKAALELALRNWNVQHEPLDARLVLEAALAADDREAARPVLEWLSSNSVEHAALRQLQAQLGAQP